MTSMWADGGEEASPLAPSAHILVIFLSPEFVLYSGRVAILFRMEISAARSVLGGLGN